MQIVLILIYVLFAAAVGALLRGRTGGFWLFFALSLTFSPLLIGLIGVLFNNRSSEKPSA